MADDDFSTLQSIFRMMSPADLTGTPENTAGQAMDPKPASLVLESILRYPGALTVPDILAKLQEIQSDDPDQQVHKVLRFYSSEGNFTSDGVDWHLTTPTPEDPSEPTMLANGEEGFAKLVGLREAVKDKKMAVVLSDADYISPLTIAARDSELFLNFIPSHVMSRCVPYLSVEMVLDRFLTSPSGRLQTPGLLKFLLGAANRDEAVTGNADAMLVEGNVVGAQSDNTNEKLPSDKTLAGMELFTSPQTLQNPRPLPAGSRYVDVVDPFRPLASIESLTINIKGTVGLMSYKTGNLTIKLHDRSRLNELADLIKPTIYGQTTLWLTYGWRHPDEPNNPYAQLINGNMLVREAYGIANSSYSFDQVGQVTINLQLYTKGVRELRDIRITEGKGSFEEVNRRLEEIAEKINGYRIALGLDKPTGVLKELRAVQVLEAASQGAYPNLSPKETLEAIDRLDKSFLSNTGKIDSEAATKLRKLLTDLYETDAKRENFVFSKNYDNVATKVIERLFNEVKSGPDPFLPTLERENKRAKQLGNNQETDGPETFAQVTAKYNETLTRDRAVRENRPKFRRLVSFGKLFSTFLMNGLGAIPGIDEIQVFFYPINKRAGAAAGHNLAEFPIDTSVFADQFKNEILRLRSDKITLESFLKLIIDAQLADVRGPGYGLSGHFEPYDPKNRDPQLKKKQQEQYESSLAQSYNSAGSFVLPVVDVYVETIYVAPKTNKVHDLLKSFEAQQVSDVTPGLKNDKYTRVIRVHVFDKTIDPYPLLSEILKGDTTQNFREALDKATAMAQKHLNNVQALQGLVSIDENGLRIDATQNDAIKRIASLTIPTIVYGSNATMVKDANVSTKQDALLTATQMIGSMAGRPTSEQPNGGGRGGLPMRVIPASVSLNTMGNPLVRYAQMYFVDFNTGTTVDNKYGVTGITHTISPGKFDTQMEMTWYDAYGRFESSPTVLKAISSIEVPEENES